jgi:predicted amidophosphoribosyltransferase
VDTPTCPACTAPGLTLVRKGELRCSYCGSSYRGIPHICPSCGWINVNEAEICPTCGEPLTVIAQVIHRSDTTGGPQWMKRVQSQLGEIRSAEEHASQLRLQALQEIDQKRENVLAEQSARQSKADRNLYLTISIFALVMILGIILIWVVAR